MQRTSSNRSHQYNPLLWRGSEIKRISVRSTTIPFVKQASNSSIQTNFTAAAGDSSDVKVPVVIDELLHLNNNKVRLKNGGNGSVVVQVGEKVELKLLGNVNGASLRESEEDKYLNC